MGIFFKIGSFYFMIIAVGISTFQLASASDAAVLKNTNTPTCADSSRLLEIHRLCIDDSAKESDINIAVESLNDMIVECPEDGHYTRMVRAACFTKENKLSEALSDYQFVLASRYPSSFVHHEIGSIYLKQGRYEKAIQEFTIVINEYPSILQDHIDRASAYKESGNIESALSDYRTFLNLANERKRTNSKIMCISCYSPGEVDIYLEMGSLLEQGGNVKGAITLYKEGLENNPGSLRLQDILNEYITKK